MLPDDTKSQTNQAPPTPPDLTSGGLTKEKEFITQEEKYIEEIGKELELEKEVREAGVEKISEEITLPEPVRSLGVEESGPSTPLPQPGTSNVPLTQAQIKKALHKKIADSILWLAYWCLRQLKITNTRNKKDI